MDWPGYQTCCHRAALSTAAAFCAECRCPLLRCIAFSECMQLIEPTKHCQVCLSPELVIDAGAAVDARVGERFTIPLIIRNQSVASKRPMWVLRKFKRESGAELVSILQDWRTVEAGEEREFYLEAGPFESAGTVRVDILLEIAMRSKEGFQEAYLFGGTVLVTVSAESAQSVVQNINLSGSHFETGGLVKTDLRTDSSETTRETTKQRQVVSLQRFDQTELDLSTRGYRQQAYRVPRNVMFNFRGFTQSDAPSYEVGVGAKGMLSFGRTARDHDEKTNPFPSDVTLRIYKRDCSLDTDRSLRFSRHHFDLLILNGQLTLYVRSALGVLVNGIEVNSGEVHVLHDGDALVPMAMFDGFLKLVFKFANRAHGLIQRIDVIREPDMAEH